MLTCGKTRFGTGRSLALVNYCIVTESVNNRLCYDNLVTHRAMLTFGKTSVFAIGSNRCINNFGVTESGNCFLCDDSFAASLTFLAIGAACFCAGCSYALDDFLIVTHRWDFLSFLLAARAFANLNARLRTGGIFGNGPLAILVLVEHLAG